MCRMILLTLLIASTISAPMLAQDSLNVTLMAQLNTPGEDRGVAVSGDFAYVACSYSGLSIVDVSDPANPILVGLYDTQAANNVVVSGDYAFVADRNAGLRIIDVSDPANPVEIGFYIPLRGASDLAVSGDYAYVVDGGYLLIIDISDLTNPVETGSIDLPGQTLTVAVSGEYAYVACGREGGLQIINVSDPEHPEWTGFYNIFDGVSCVAVSGDYAFIGRSYLRVIDISDPAHPVEIGILRNIIGAQYRMAVSGDYVFIADYVRGLRIAEVSDPTHPVEVGYYDTNGDGYGVAVSQPYAYFADAHREFKIFDCTQALLWQRDVTMIVPLQGNYFELVSTYIIPENLNALSVFGNIANLEIVYQSNGNIFIPQMFNTIGEISLTEGYWIFCSDESEWTVEGQLMNPATEYHLIAGLWNWISYPFDFPVPVTTALADLIDDIVIIIADDGRLWIPPAINTMGNMLPGEGYMVFPLHDVTFQYHFNGLLTAGSNSVVLEIPEVFGAPLPTGLPYAVLVRLTDELKAQNPFIIELYDNNLLVGKGAVLLENEITPVIAWKAAPEYNLPGFSTGQPITVKIIAANGSVLATTTSGKFSEGPYTEVTLDIESIPLPTEFAVQSVYPNPFNPTINIPFALPNPGEVIISIYNLLGQRIYAASNYYRSGWHRFVFDASSTGVEFVSGMYFLQVRYQGEEQTQKIILLK